MQTLKTGVAFAGALALALGMAALPALAQKKGGELNYVVGSKIPSYDGHAESTFGMIHPIRPFYSLLIRVNPDNPGDPTDIGQATLVRRRGSRLAPRKGLTTWMAAHRSIASAPRRPAKSLPA